MKERVELLVREFRDARRHRLRFEAAVTALSVLVTGGVFWQLRRVGTAISEEGAPPGVPVIETDADPPDQTTEAAETAEDPADWEALLPEFTDESPQQRIAAIAVSQLGYTEGEGEVLLSDDGVSRTGYTRYGAWYGNPYGEWNTMFTYFCMYYAGIEKDRIPYGSGCWAWYETLSENGMLTPCGNETEGDIIFFDSDADGEPDRTGIVSGTEETEEGVQLHVIAGNCEGAVAEQQYLRGGSDMVGVLSVDSYLTEPLTPSEPEIVLISYSADSESGIHVDAQAAEGVFPEGTVMKAADVPDEEALQAAAEMYADCEVSCKAAVDISFIGPDGSELQPGDGNSVQVRLMLPSEMMPDEDFQVLHVPDSGTPEQVDLALRTPDGVAFHAEAFSIYIIATVNHQAPSQQNLNTVINKYSYPDNWYEDCGTQNHPYVVYLGDVIEVVGNGDSFVVVGNEGYKLRRTADGNDRPHQLNDGSWGRHAAYYADSPGTCYIQNGNDRLYVEVREPIMVKAEHGYKQKDRIREYLGPNEAYPINFGLTNKDGYVPNGKSRPYLLHVGEILDIYAYAAAGDTEIKFWDETYTSVPRNDDVPLPGNVVPWNSPDIGTYRAIEPITQWNNERQAWDVVEYDAEAGKDKHSIQFRAIKPGFNCIHFGNQEFWVRVMDDDMFTHADMEIADGGTYSITSVRYEGGKKYTDVKVYNACVSYVNYADIFDANNTQLSHFSSEDGDYENIGSSGSTQYELSSAYICTLNPGTKGSKYYHSQLADHAVFNVQLKLDPFAKYSLDENGDIVSDSVQPFTEDSQTIDNVFFYLNHAAVLDAKNKCPLNNGLDFTVRAQSAVLKFDAQKELNGRTLKDKEFTFEVIDPNNENQVVATAQNDADGKIVFDNILFEEPGNVTYKLREVIPAAHETGLRYTEEVYDLNIVVKKNIVNFNGVETELLYAELGDTDCEELIFRNSVFIELPDTGGTGPLPYLAVGTLLISAAFALPLIRRRKEDECDS